MQGQFEKQRIQMGNKIKVSVIIPVYNTEKYLSQCLDSVVSQTLKDIEIICVDDGSKDNSSKILNDYAQKDPRIKSITQENRGPSSARNAGLRAAHGEYISFVDSDDMVTRDFCKKAYSLVSKKTADILVFSGITKPREEWIEKVFDIPDGTYDSSEATNLLFTYENARIFDATKIFRREFLSKNDLWFPEQFRIGEDQVLLFMAFPVAKRVVFTKEKFYMYRQEVTGSLMDTYEKNHEAKMRVHMELVKYILSCWKEKGWIAGNEKKLSRWLIDFLIPGFKTSAYNCKKECMSRAKKALEDINSGVIPDEIKDEYDEIKGFAEHLYVPKISLVIPINESNEKELPRAISELKKQSYPDTKIYFLKDGQISKETDEILSRFLKEDSRAEIQDRSNAVMTGGNRLYVDIRSPLSKDMAENAVRMTDELFGKEKNVAMFYVPNEEYIEKQKELLELDLASITGSVSYRLGRMITYIPRMCRKISTDLFGNESSIGENNGTR